MPVAAGNSAPLPATVSVCFTPAENCVASIVAAIAAAQTEIRVQAYRFTSPPIVGALVAAQRRGVDVDVAVLLDKVNDRDEEIGREAPRGRYTGATFVANAGIPVWIDDSKRIAHIKAIIIHNRLTIGGTYNYTISAEQRNVEDVTFIESALIANRFLANWNARRSVSRVYALSSP